MTPLDPDTLDTVRCMVAYVGCDNRIARHVGCDPEQVAHVRRSIPKPRGRPPFLVQPMRESGGAGEDYRILTRASAVRGSALLAERINRMGQR